LSFFQRADSRFFIYFIFTNVLQKYNKKKLALWDNIAIL
jgi:hypothetical protein